MFLSLMVYIRKYIKGCRVALVVVVVMMMMIMMTTILLYIYAE